MIRILIVIFPSLFSELRGLLRTLISKRSLPVFENHYIDAKSLYRYRFGSIPNISIIQGVDVGKVFEYVTGIHSGMVSRIYQSCEYNFEAGKQEFDKTLFVMKNKVIIELAYRYARILYQSEAFQHASELLAAFSEFKVLEKQEDFEINIITYSNSGLDLKRLDIKPANLDLHLFYNDDFIEVDKLIKSRLNMQNDKGIVLLHGLPGTGKTSYLRHLVGELKKKVLFVSPSVAGNLMNPEFVDLLIENPNSVLVIEDAENILMNRKYNSDSSVSNLLNLSDGLLSDCVSVQVICTFNSDLNLIDDALMRKGRLIARYEFGKLSVEKSQRLSDHLGFETVIKMPMTVAEITNQHDMQFEIKRIEIIGFKRHSDLAQRC
ncbi:AAA family ATPase [Pollutibacter soli]|uniref:AAA family ATPase n=1 Tax=Pollutibacter soli TaxID=3034157 RepID=UPI003013FF52